MQRNDDEVQPLDLTRTQMKRSFTIDYLTSTSSEIKEEKKFLPLQSLDNQRPTRLGALELVNGGRGIKNPLFDCATEALQNRYGSISVSTNERKFLFCEF